MKSNRNRRNYKKVKIYHHELNLENEYNTTFFLITEIVEGIPLRTHYFKIPDNFKNDVLLGSLPGKYSDYCPN